MKKYFITGALVFALADCGQLQGTGNRNSGTGFANGNPSTNAEGQLRPRSRPEGLGLGHNDVGGAVSTLARTVEDFDTTTAVQRSMAGAGGGGAGRTLGETVASLGDPTQPGFWLKTPLINAPAKGRVTSAQTGKSVLVDLIPIEGENSAASRISLAALRLLGVPLTALPTVVVFVE